MYFVINGNARTVVDSIGSDSVQQYERLLRERDAAHINTKEYQNTYREFWTMNQSGLSAPSTKSVSMHLSCSTLAYSPVFPITYTNQHNPAIRIERSAKPLCAGSIPARASQTHPSLASIVMSSQVAFAFRSH